MLVKAKVPFAGEVTMGAGEVRDVPEDVVAPLVACGYLTLAEGKKTKKKV